MSDRKKLRRSFRPSVERCEARALLSGVPSSPAAVAPLLASRRAIEPLAFEATVLKGQAQGLRLKGTLELKALGGGDLSGRLVQAGGAAVPVSGTLNGDQILLRFRLAPGKTLQVLGPVIQQRLASGQLTFNGRGDVLGPNRIPVGPAIFDGSASVTVPMPVRGGPGALAGATIAPSQFVAYIRQGPDAGQSYPGTLILGKVGRDGVVRGTLNNPTAGAIPVTGRVGGGLIELRFDLGQGKTIVGTGPLTGLKDGSGRLVVSALGSLSGPAPGDTGDWDVSPLSYANLDYAQLPGLSQINVEINQTSLRSANLVGANFSGTTFYYVNFQGANLSGANLTGATFVGTTLAGANLTGARLDYANLSGANVAGANLTGASLVGTNFTFANMDDAVLNSAKVSNTAFYGARLNNTVLAKVQSMMAPVRTLTKGYASNGNPPAGFQWDPSTQAPPVAPPTTLPSIPVSPTALALDVLRQITQPIHLLLDMTAGGLYGGPPLTIKYQYINNQLLPDLADLAWSTPVDVLTSTAQAAVQGGSKGSFVNAITLITTYRTTVPLGFVVASSLAKFVKLSIAGGVGA